MKKHHTTTLRSVTGPLCAALVVSLLTADAAMAASPFNGNDVTVTWEYWTGSSPGEGGTFLATTDSAVVQASDAVTPDVPDFHQSTGTTFELWDVDFHEETIRLTYTSIYVWDFDHQYMYLSPVGFHIEDVAAVVGEIENVAVESSFAPFGFDPTLVSFDADNIWVNLEGSMCHYHSMGSMPACTNPTSPTAYDNEILLTVTVPEPASGAAFAAGLTLLATLARRRDLSRRSMSGGRRRDSCGLPIMHA